MQTEQEKGWLSYFKMKIKLDVLAINIIGLFFFKQQKKT